jgi:hypothetical protein
MYAKSSPKYLFFKGYSPRKYSKEYRASRLISEELVQKLRQGIISKEPRKTGLIPDSLPGIPLTSHSLIWCISAGTYAALISWFRGYQYTPRGISHHQIMAHPLSRYNPKCHITSRAAVLPFLAEPGPELTTYLSICLRTIVRSKVVGSGSTLDRLSSVEKVKTLKEILRDQGIATKDDFSPLWSKGDQETFRRGALVRAETPRDRVVVWNQRRNYRVHPYFTSNLKYVV